MGKAIELPRWKLQVHTSGIEVPLFVERVLISRVHLGKLSVSFKDKLVLVVPLLAIAWIPRISDHHG